MAPAAEMGQGTMTALAVVFAEELDADWNKVAVEFSPADDALYGNPMPFFFGMMVTAASTAVMAYYKNMRLYGAQARRVLLDAAANAPQRSRVGTHDGTQRGSPRQERPAPQLRRDRELRYDARRHCPPFRKKISRIRASSG